MGLEVFWVGRRVPIPGIGVLFGWVASKTEGDSWFRWGLFYVPGKPI